MKPIFNKKKKEAYATNVSRRNQIEKIREFVELYKQQFESIQQDGVKGLDMDVIHHMEILTGYFPEAKDRPTSSRLDIIPGSIFHGYDTLSNWRQELTVHRSKDVIYMLNTFIGKLEKQIFDSENQYYPIEFFDQVKEKAKIFFVFLFKTTAGKIISLLIAAGISYLALSLFGIKINP